MELGWVLGGTERRTAHYPGKHPEVNPVLLALEQDGCLGCLRVRAGAQCRQAGDHFMWQPSKAGCPSPKRRSSECCMWGDSSGGLASEERWRGELGGACQASQPQTFTGEF